MPTSYARVYLLAVSSLSNPTLPAKTPPTPDPWVRRFLCARHTQASLPSIIRQTPQAALRHKSKSSAVDGTAQTAPLFNPVYQSTDGNNGQAASSATVADRGSLAGAAADEPETPRNSRGMETLPGHYGAVAAGGSEQFAEAAMAAAAASGEDGGGDHDEDDDANVDWEEGGDEGNDGGGALGAGRRAVVDSDGDEGELLGFMAENICWMCTSHCRYQIRVSVFNTSHHNI